METYSKNLPKNLLEKETSKNNNNINTQLYTDIYTHEYCGYPANWTYSANDVYRRLNNETSVYTSLNTGVTWSLGFLALFCSFAGVFINVTLLMALFASTRSGGRQIKFGQLGLINKLTINLLLADACYSFVLFFASFSLFARSNKIHALQSGFRVFWGRKLDFSGQKGRLRSFRVT